MGAVSEHPESLRQQNVKQHCYGNSSCQICLKTQSALKDFMVNMSRNGGKIPSICLTCETPTSSLPTDAQMAQAGTMTKTTGARFNQPVKQMHYRWNVTLYV